MVSITEFRSYAKIASNVCDNFSDGIASQEKLRELIGAEFNLLSPPAIEKHLQNMVMGRFFTASISGMKAAPINWVYLENKLQQKAKELAEKEAENV